MIIFDENKALGRTGPGESSISGYSPKIKSSGMIMFDENRALGITKKPEPVAPAEPWTGNRPGQPVDFSAKGLLTQSQSRPNTLSDYLKEIVAPPKESLRYTPPRSNTGMLFTVGEGLTPEQKTQAEQTIQQELTKAKEESAILENIVLNGGIPGVTEPNFAAPEHPDVAKFLNTFTNSTIAGKALQSSNPTYYQTSKDLSQQFMEERPVLGTVAKLMATVTDMLMFRYSTGNFSISGKAMTGLGELANLSPTTARMFTQALESGTMFSIQNAANNLIDQAITKEARPMDTLKEAAGSFAAGVVFGVGGAASTLPKQVAYTAGGIGALNLLEKLIVNKRITGTDLVEATINAAVSGIIQGIIGRGTPEQFKAEDFARLNKSVQIGRIMRGGMNRQEAEQWYNLIEQMSAITNFQKFGIWAPTTEINPREIRYILEEAQPTFQKLTTEQMVIAASRAAEKASKGTPIGQAMKEASKEVLQEQTKIPNTATADVNIIANKVTAKLKEGKGLGDATKQAIVETAIENKIRVEKAISSAKPVEKKKPAVVSVTETPTATQAPAAAPVTVTKTQTPAKTAQVATEADYKPTKKPTDRSIYDVFIEGTYNGERFTTNRYILEFNSNTEVPKGRELQTFPNDSTIKQIIPTKGLKPARLVEAYNSSNEKNSSKYLDITDGKNNATLNRDLYDYFAKKYKNISLEMVDSSSPVVVKQDGQMRGLIMPMMGVEKKLGNISIWKAPVVPEAKPGKRMPKGISAVKAGEGVKGPQNISAFEQRGKITINMNELPVPRGTEEFKLFEKVQEFIKKYAGKFAETTGKRPGNALGWYAKDSRDIYINGRTNVSVASHETTHFVDDNLKITDKIIADAGKNTRIGIAGDLRKLYRQYYANDYVGIPVKTQIEEGYATLIEKYTEMPETVKAEYPDLVSELLTPGGRYYEPIIGEMLKDLDTIVTDYQALNSEDKIGARVQNKQTKYSQDTWLSRGAKVSAVIDDVVYPLEVFDNILGLGNTKDSISLLLRLYQVNHHLAAQNIIGKSNLVSGRNGFFMFDPASGNLEKTLDYNWADLISKLDKKAYVEKFGYWLVSRRKFYDYQTLDELTAKVNDLRNQMDNELNFDILRDIKKEYRATVDLQKQYLDIIRNDGITRQEATDNYELNASKYREYAEMFDALTRQEIVFLRRARKITEDKYNELIQERGYASYRREIYNDIQSTEEATDSTIKVGRHRVSALLPRRGSEKAILNPLYSAVQNHLEITRKGIQQIIYNKVHDAWVPNLAEVGLASIIRKVPLEPQISESGIVSYSNQEKKPNIIMAFDKDGKRIAYEVDPSIKKYMDTVLTPQNTGLIMQMAQTITRTFTMGTTGFYFQFALVNPVIDQPSAIVNTANNYVPLYSQLKLVKQYLKDPQLRQFWDEYMILGAERQTIAGMATDSPEKTLRRISNEASLLAVGMDKLNSWVLDPITMPTKVSEIFTRFAEYAQARLSGKPMIVALEQAARVSAPFSHIGSWGNPFIQGLIRSTEYGNAGIQIGAMAVKRLDDPEGRKRLALVALMIIGASLAAYYKFVHNATQDQINELKDKSASDRARYIYWPKSGGVGLHRVRVSEQYAIPATLMNLALSNRLEGGIDYGKLDYAEALLSTIPPQLNPIGTRPIDKPLEGVAQWINSWLPTGIKPPLQVATNKRFYPGIQDIESKAVQTMPVRLRVNQKTTAVAKWLSEHGADKIGLSPIKIDYLIQGYTGRTSGYILGKPGAFDVMSGFNEDYYFKGGRALKKYYEVKSNIEQEQTAFKKGLGERKATTYEKNTINKIDDMIAELNKMDIEQNQDNAAALRTNIMNYITDFLGNYSE